MAIGLFFLESLLFHWKSTHMETKILPLFLSFLMGRKLPQRAETCSLVHLPADRDSQPPKTKYFNWFCQCKEDLFCFQKAETDCKVLALQGKRRNTDRVLEGNSKTIQFQLHFCGKKGFLTRSFWINDPNREWDQKKVEKKPIYATISPLLIPTNAHMCTLTLTSIMDELWSFCSWKAALDDLIYLLVLLFNFYFGLLFIMQNNTLIFYSAEHLISVKLYLLACITAFCLVCRQCKISQIVHNSDWLQKRNS